MIDPLEAVITYLNQCADIDLLVDGQVASKHQFGSGWDIPSKAIQVRLDGGTPDLYTKLHRIRLEVRCYGEEQWEAGKVWRALLNVMHDLERKVVQTGEGRALLYYLVPVSGPSYLVDPDTGIDFLMVFCEALVAWQDVL